MSLNSPSVEIFLNRINWKVNMGEMKQMDTFRIDVYQFDFIHPLKNESLTSFTKFIRNLPMNEVRSILKIWIWLYQHKIKFRLRFSWNENLSIKHNLKNFTKPGKLNRKIKSCGHDNLMNYQFEEKEE